MNKDNLPKIYELYMNEGLTLFKGYEQRLSFYAGLIVAIIGGILYCFLSIGLCPTFLFVFLLGLILLIIISELSVWSLDRLYKQLLINITVRAKIENDLEMTKERKESKSNKNNWDGWKPEPYIFQTRIESREKYCSSEKFVKGESKKGYQLKIRRAIRSVYIAFIIIFIFINVIFVHSCLYW